MELGPSRLYVLCLLAVLLTSQLPAGAADLDKILAEYDRGDTAAACNDATEFVKNNPNDATAWYILGNCFLKQHAPQVAAEAFQRCLALKPQGQIAAYAMQALSVLQPQGTPSVNTQQNSPAADYAKSVNRTSVQSDSQQAQISADLDVRIREKERQRRERILKVQTESQKAIAAIPLYYYDSDGDPYPNPDRPRQVAQIQADEAQKIESITESCDKDEEAFRSTTQQRLEALSDFTNHTIVSSRTGSRNLQQTPRGTNLFVHNYVNFGLDEDEPPRVVPLRAKALPYNPPEYAFHRHSRKSATTPKDPPTSIQRP